MSQDEALNILKLGYSVFLTGAAGTGKTFILNQYIDYLKLNNIHIAITASTGIAATHINGQTIHSWSGIGIAEKLDTKLIDKLLQTEKLYKKYNNLKVLIIDEISMLHGSRLDMINTLFKKFKDNNLPFGGVQVIFCGDFFQLPPVIKNNSLNTLFTDNNQDNILEKEFAYNSKAWQELNPIICYLEKNYRQSDDELNLILNQIRENSNQEEIYNKLLASSISTKPTLNKKKVDILKLYTHNIDVDSINLRNYLKLDKRKEYTYNLSESGNKNMLEFLKKNCLAPESISLRLGTKIIFIKNDKSRRYQNGTLGKVVDFDTKQMPIVETYDGDKLILSPDSWQSVDDNGKVQAEISQLPIKYAWAITIHKSQGMTLDAAEIDLSKAFGTNMGYVALSRVKSLENINLIGLNQKSLNINYKVLAQDKIFKEKSKKAVEAIQKYYLDNKSKQELKKKQEDFLNN